MLELIRELLCQAAWKAHVSFCLEQDHTKSVPTKAEVERTCGCCAPLRFSSAVQPQAMHKVKPSLALLVPPRTSPEKPRAPQVVFVRRVPEHRKPSRKRCPAAGRELQPRAHRG